MSFFSTCLGVPVIQAQSEGEAQAAHIVRRGDAYAVATQDADALIFGSTRLVRNLSLAGKRKQVGKLSYQEVKPELIDLGKALGQLAIDQEQLICLSMLVGTDYNPGGIKGIGQKGALKLVLQHGHDFDALFSDAGWQQHFPELGWRTVFDTIKTVPVTDSYELRWQRPDVQSVVDMLVTEFDFSEERVLSSLAKLAKVSQASQQRGLGDFA